MKHIVRFTLLVLLLASGVPLWAAPKVWQIVIVHDTKEDFALKIVAGFKASMDAQLRARGESAAYTQFDTELSEPKAAEIVKAIRALGPDLIFNVNNPTCFADNHVARVLKDPKYRFVAENAIPVQSGAAATWDKPGGNETGVGVFIPFTAQLRLMKMIRPQATKLMMFSWEAATLVNDWYEKEARRACKEEGIELLDYKLFPHAEAQMAWMPQWANKGPEYFMSEVIAAWVHEDGTWADMAKIEGDFIKKSLRVPLIIYDEVSIQIGALAGACVIWGDLGAQAADKGLKILDGANPGDLAWEYPRNYNIVLNMATAKRLGITFPANLVSAAYRIYTDDEGHFVGK